MAKTKAKSKPTATTHMAKVPLADLGQHWATGYDLKGAELGDVVTHFDPHTRTAIVEYVTLQPAGQPPVQKVTARRRKRKL